MYEYFSSSSGGSGSTRVVRACRPSTAAVTKLTSLPVLPDHIRALANRRDFDAVGHDLEFVIIMTQRNVLGDSKVQRCGICEVQGNDGKVPLANVQAERARITGTDDARGLAGSAGAATRRQ